MLLQNSIFLAWNDTKARYKKSILGPFWLTAGNLIGVLGLSLVWSKLLGEELSDFAPALTIGLIVWQLIAGSVGEAPSIFIQQSKIIKSIAIPPWFFVVRSLSRQCINFLHNLIIIIGVLLYFDISFNASTFLVIPGLFLVLANLFWMSYLLGVFGARFRDIEHLINSFLPLLFFISPVIFRAERLPVDMNIIWLNPFSYFIEIIRSPTLGEAPEPETFFVMLMLLVIGGITTICIHKVFCQRLTFWV